MIKHLMTVAFAFLAIGNAAAQNFEHAQTRIQEGTHEFFVRPAVAKLDVSKTRKETPENEPILVYEGVSFDVITNDMLENAKANAAYKAAKMWDADIILGATFYVTYNKQKKGLDVSVSGYPAKYTDFHPYGEGQDDNKWFDALMTGQRNRLSQRSSESIQAVRTDTKK